MVRRFVIVRWASSNGPVDWYKTELAVTFSYCYRMNELVPV